MTTDRFPLPSAALAAVEAVALAAALFATGGLRAVAWGFGILVLAAAAFSYVSVRHDLQPRDMLRWTYVGTVATAGLVGVCAMIAMRY